MPSKITFFLVAASACAPARAPMSSGATPPSPATQPLAAPPELAAPPSPDASDPQGIPAPPAELAELPTDVRLPDRATWERGYDQDCEALAASPCELSADLDGDGAPELVVETRSKSSGHAGIAVSWSRGGVSIIGAGAPSRQLRTDVYVDGVELEWVAVEDELSFVRTWKILPRSTDGFVAAAAGMRPSTSAAASLPAPAATGAGLWLDGGDAAEVLYWDGTAWRRLVVGL